MEVRYLGVVGAGQMGKGIALVAALKGIPVFLYDDNPDALRTAVRRIEDTLDRMHTKGNLTHRQMDETLGRVVPTTNLEGNPDAETRGIGAVDFVIEAITENPEAKKNLFRRIEPLLGPAVIIATNTSTILIEELTEAVERKDKFVGMHFMNPPHILTLLEVIRGPQTSDATHEAVMGLAKQLGRTPIIESPDIPGFTVNGIVLPLINEAARLVARGVTPENADRAFEGRVATGGEPMGILRLADLIGIDTCVAGLREMAKEDRHYTPHPILVNMVKEGRLGRKTREGFFLYET